jgi:hypothetical protein
MPFYFSEDSVGFTGSGTGGGGTSVAGAVNYKGTWNALTNTPTLSNSSGGGANGDYYLVSVGGSTSLDGLSTWNVGDWVVSNGSIWERLLGQGSSLTGSIVNADISSSAAIAYSKLNLASSVANSDLTNMTQATIKGRATGGGTGSPQDLTSAQVLTILGIGGARIIKSGTVAGSSFAGNPKTVAVTFGTAFPNTNYQIVILSNTNRTWTWSSKATTGFTINANANAAFASGNVDWFAISTGESVE